MKKKQCHIYNTLLKKLNQIIFHLFFDNCLDFKSLWHSIDKVLHRSNPSQQIPYNTISRSRSFFDDKIKIFPLNLPLINTILFSVLYKSPPIVSLFKPISFDKIKQLILSSPK